MTSGLLIFLWISILKHGHILPLLSWEGEHHYFMPVIIQLPYVGRQNSC